MQLCLFFWHQPQLGWPRSHLTFLCLHVSQDTESGRLRFAELLWSWPASSALESPALQWSWSCSSSRLGECCENFVLFESGLT